LLGLILAASGAARLKLAFSEIPNRDLFVPFRSIDIIILLVQWPVEDKISRVFSTDIAVFSSIILAIERVFKPVSTDIMGLQQSFNEVGHRMPKT
jgi:di/tricarboxylate transporter